MAGIPEKNNEKVAPSSRPLHNFDLPLRWGHQKHLRCVKSTQSTTAHSVTPTSVIPSRLTKSPARVSRRSPTTTHSVTPTSVIPSRLTKSPARVSRRPPTTACPISYPKINKGKSVITSSADEGTGEIDGVHQKLMNDLRVAMDDHLKLGCLEVNGKADTGMKPAEDPLPWNLRNRQSFGKSLNESGKDLWPVRRSDRGYRSFLASDRRDASGSSEQRRPKFSVALSKAEIEADFLVMTGAKPPRRPKKRSKSVQKKVDGIFPGSWLSEVTPERYKVPNAPESKK